MAQHDDAHWPTCSPTSSGAADTKALFRRLLQQARNELIEIELTAAMGGAPGGTDTRTNHRHGGRAKIPVDPGGRCEAAYPQGQDRVVLPVAA